MNKISPGAKRFSKWMGANGYKLSVVSRQLKDGGRQVQHWTSGDRETLSLRLLCEISVLSGIAIERLVSPKQRALIRQLAKTQILNQEAA